MRARSTLQRSKPGVSVCFDLTAYACLLRVRLVAALLAVARGRHTAPAGTQAAPIRLDVAPGQ